MRVEFSAAADAVSSPDALLAQAISAAGVRGHHVTALHLVSRSGGDPVQVVVELVMIGDRPERTGE